MADRYRSQFEPRVLSILSGKGGVGKSVLAFNLAHHFSTLRIRVLLVDADFAAGNLHVLANVPSRVGANEYLTRQLSLGEAITKIDDRLSLLAASWNDRLAEDRNVVVTAQFLNDLRADASSDYDLIIVDHASGRSNQSATLAHASDLNLLVVVPELTSLTDAYALYKFLIGLNRHLPCGLVINRTQSSDEVGYIRTKFPELTQRFLGTSPIYCGFLSESTLVRKSIANQSPWSQMEPGSSSTNELDIIANRLADIVLIDNGPTRANPDITINKVTATADIRG